MMNKINPWKINIIKKIISHHDKAEKENESKSSILIFLPGLHEINKTHQSLKALEKRTGQNYLIFLVHSTLTTHKNNRELKRLLAAPPVGSRKIILSTIICESSITVPDIKIVIDLCLTKTQNKCTTTNLTKLTLSWASHENCDQRKGRAGRVQAGTCYRILPKVGFRYHWLQLFLTNHSWSKLIRKPSKGFLSSRYTSKYPTRNFAL